MTAQLCAAAWTLFQEIEKAGGAAAALAQGLIQRKVAATRAEREKNIARRRDALTGTSEFPDIHEAAVHVLDVAPRAIERRSSAPRSPCRASASPSRSRRCATPPTARWPQPARGQKCSSPISASSSDFTARTLFAKNFFEAGGIEAVSNDGFASRDDMIAAFKASGAKLACLCSSDKVYEQEAVDAAKALGAAGAAHIYLAGRPGELEAALKAAGYRISSMSAATCWRR